MRVIIAGSRNITDYEIVRKGIETSGFCITSVVCGKADGVDTIGEYWAELRGIPVKPFNAKWRKYGINAGKIRNEEMACNADALIAIWDGESTGTEDMIKRARKHKLMVSIHMVNEKVANLCDFFE